MLNYVFINFIYTNKIVFIDYQKNPIFSNLDLIIEQIENKQEKRLVHIDNDYQIITYDKNITTKIKFKKDELNNIFKNFIDTLILELNYKQINNLKLQIVKEEPIIKQESNYLKYNVIVSSKSYRIN